MSLSQRRAFEEMGRSVSTIIRELDRYAAAYERAYDSEIGNDAVIGDAWIKIAKGVHGLLDGETGRLDPGDASAKIFALVRAVKFTSIEFDEA